MPIRKEEIKPSLFLDMINYVGRCKNSLKLLRLTSVFRNAIRYIVNKQTPNLFVLSIKRKRKILRYVSKDK